MNNEHLSSPSSCSSTSLNFSFFFCFYLLFLTVLEELHLYKDKSCLYDIEYLKMEQYLRQRIDCPPPGGTRILIEEKDNIIKKQQDELNKLQLQLKTLQTERDYIFSLLSNEQKSSINHM
jgi:hypothetical protein